MAHDDGCSRAELIRRLFRLTMATYNSGLFDEKGPLFNEISVQFNQLMQAVVLKQQRTEAAQRASIGMLVKSMKPNKGPQ